ncbi:MAG: peptide chain release factor N(5)-glutamine methyltransferase [Lachnospiraceae bacterium]|nr:peptide chain release factor N(5)-glutamine methyltransferase [Lachnospiraceae bacterium]
MRYSDAKKKAASELKAAGIEEAEVDAEYLLLVATGLERSSLFVKLYEEMPKREAEIFEKLVERRADHEPLQYIIGSTEFMGYSFIVTQDVLIPRFDTEILAELAVKRSLEAIKAKPGFWQKTDSEEAGLKVLDLCTGSGCVAVSVGFTVMEKLLKNDKKYSENIFISVTGADISKEALEIAGRNFELNLQKSIFDMTGCKIDFLESDLFSLVKGKFHIITANPPYIVRNEIQDLMPEITEHEPHLALDGGDDGMDFYRRICREAPGYLFSGGRLIMEFDDSQAEPVGDMMREAGFAEIEVHRDLAGLRRVIEGVITEK